MSVSLSNSVPPHFGQAKPAGRRSFASRAYQASARLRLEEVRHVAREVGAQQDLAAPLAVEGGDRHAPQPLARDAPVGARRDHVADALLAPGGDPLRLRDRLEGLLAQRGPALVEGDEPLLGGAEDDRVLAAPADRVGVRVLAGLQEGARLAQELHDRGVRVEDLLPGEALDLGQEAPRLVHGAVDVEAVADAGEVVVPAVAGGGVDDAGAGVEGDVVGQDDGRVAVDPGVAEAQALEVRALRLGEGRAERRRGAGGVALRAPASLGGLAQRLRDQQDVVRALDRVEGVLGVGVDARGRGWRAASRASSSR